jgi:hypothetical protein
MPDARVTAADDSSMIYGPGRTHTHPEVELPMRIALLILGVLTAILILCQLVMGQLIAGGSVNLIKSHQHTGYLTVVVTIVYVGLSLAYVLSSSSRAKA